MTNMDLNTVLWCLVHEDQAVSYARYMCVNYQVDAMCDDKDDQINPLMCLTCNIVGNQVK